MKQSEVVAVIRASRARMGEMLPLTEGWRVTSYRCRHRFGETTWTNIVDDAGVTRFNNSAPVELARVFLRRN